MLLAECRLITPVLPETPIATHTPNPVELYLPVTCRGETVTNRLNRSTETDRLTDTSLQSELSIVADISQLALALNPLLRVMSINGWTDSTNCDEYRQYQGGSVG